MSEDPSGQIAELLRRWLPGGEEALTAIAPVAP
jgi:hypothetical protein